MSTQVGAEIFDFGVKAVDNLETVARDLMDEFPGEDYAIYLGDLAVGDNFSHTDKDAIQVLEDLRETPDLEEFLAYESILTYARQSAVQHAMMVPQQRQSERVAA